MKRYQGILSVILILVLLSGCSLRSREAMLIEYEPSEAKKQIPLSFFGYKADAANLTAIENILQQYMELHPDYTVTYEGVKGTDYWEALEKRAKADALDDVFMVDHDRVIELTEQGMLADLSGLSVIQQYQDYMKEQFIDPDGSVYFLPTCISAYGLYINYDLLEEHGQKIPENWSDFSDVCNYFVEKGITPIIINNYASLRSLIVSKSLYSVYQHDSAAAIEGFNLHPEELLDTLRPGIEMAEEMINSDWIDCAEALTTNQTSDDLKLFLGGDRPFMVTGCWATLRVSAENPEFSYGVHAFPILEDGGVLEIDANTCISVNADSEHLEEAIQLSEYITQPDNIQNYCDSQSSYSPLLDGNSPSDETILPATACFEDGRVVIGSDYRLDLPLDTSLTEITLQMLNGMPEDKIVRMLRRLLSN